MKKQPKEEKPLLYLTSDRDGMHLWFCLGRPIRRQGVSVYMHDFPACKVRIPVSWYGGIVPDGGCIEIDLEELYQDKT